MCEELSHQIINVSAVNQAIVCYYYKFAKIITEKKTVLAVARNEDALFWMHLTEAWLELFRLI